MSDVALIESEQLISDFLHERRLALVRSQESKGLKASGRSAEKLTVLLITPTLGQLIDVAGYFYYQEHGRGPGKSPTFDDIYEWVGRQKYGITYKDDEERISITYGVLTNIRKKGTYTYRHGRTNVLRGAFTKDSMIAFLKKIGVTYKLAIKTDIVNELRQIQK